MAGFSTKPDISFSLIGHKSRCFDVKVSENRDFLLSSSEDGTAILWNLERRKVLFQFKHNLDFEVLRANFVEDILKICTCASDGVMLLWELQRDSAKKNCDHLQYSILYSFGHGDSQIYACEVIKNESGKAMTILTAADDCIHVWNLSQEHSETGSPMSSVRFPFVPIDEATASRSDSEGESDSGPAFGGPRNPDNKVYVFDAKSSPVRGTVIAVALSDGTLRVIDIATSAVLMTKFLDVQHGTGRKDHITSVAWDSEGEDVLASLGSGHVAIVNTRTETVSVFRAHENTCFGGCFIQSKIDTPTGDAEPGGGGGGGGGGGTQGCVRPEGGLAPATKQLLTWSSDCHVRLWEVQCASGGEGWTCDNTAKVPTETPGAPPCLTMTIKRLQSVHIPGFPIYSCDVGEKGGIVCGGGKHENSVFLGCPVHVLRPLDLITTKQI